VAVLAPIFGVLLVLGIWQATVWWYRVDPVVLPTPVDVLGRLGGLLREATFWHNVAVSLGEFAIGYVLGCLLGIAAGLLLAELPALRSAAHPLVETFRFIVPFAWIPLVILWFGTSTWGKVWLVTYAVFFVMVVATPASLRNVDPTLRRVATMLGMNPWRRLVRIELRSAMPSIASAARASAAIGWIAVVAAEYVGSNAGLGFLIINASSSLDTGVVIAGMAVIGLVGAGVSLLVNRFVASSAR